jgi:hypothetical protein
VAHAQRADVEADFGLPEVKVGRGERRVGEDQRDDGAPIEDAGSTGHRNAAANIAAGVR